MFFCDSSLEDGYLYDRDSHTSTAHELAAQDVDPAGHAPKTFKKILSNVLIWLSLCVVRATVFFKGMVCLLAAEGSNSSLCRHGKP